MSNLEGLHFYGDPTVDEILLQNFLTFFRYGLLEIGAFYNISLNQQDVRGNDQSSLYPVFVTGVPDYKIWRGNKHDWIWEQNINLKYSGGSQPTIPTGVFVNGTGYNNGTNVFGSGFYIDFSRGQIVFGNALPSGTSVKVPHSLRAVQVYSHEGPELRHLVSNWLDASTNSSGIIDYSYKAYLPSIFIRCQKLDTVRGLELGSRAKVTKADMEFHIFSSNPYELRKLMDICYMLEEKPVILYDIQNSPKPLNYRGELVNPSGSYPNLISSYATGFARFEHDATEFKMTNHKLPVFYGRVTVGLLTDTYPI